MVNDFSGSASKESVYNAGDPDSVPESGTYPEKGNGNPLQHSCLENSMDKEPDRLQSMELQSVRNDEETLTLDDFTNQEILKIN